MFDAAAGFFYRQISDCLNPDSGSNPDYIYFLGDTQLRLSQ